MLADKYQELLTAYVDGELSSRQRRMVQKLLRKSPEARKMLRLLQADSNALISLPAPPPAPDLSASVILRIAQQKIHPSRSSIRPQTISIRTAFAAAASVMLMVGAATYLMLSSLPNEERPNRVAQRKKDTNGTKPDNNDRIVKPDNNGAIVKKTDTDKKPEKKQPDAVVKVPEKKPEPEKPFIPEKKPEPEDIVTAPSMEVFKPNAADVSVPSLFKVKDLGQESQRSALVKDLSRSEAFYVEVLGKDTTYAFPRLQEAFRSAKIDLVVDKSASDRLKETRIKSNYGVYLEDVTPEELAALLKSLGDDDKKKANIGQFVSSEVNLFLCPMTGEHRKRLVNLLGADPREEKATSGAKAKERQAVAMAYQPTATKSPSAEVKKYLDARKPTRPGTLHVLLVLRGRP